MCRRPNKKLVGYSSNSTCNTGFTLIELIIVIVVMSALSIGSVRFISDTTQGVINAGERQRIASIGIIALEKVARELREALPYSIRVDGTGECIEFVPVTGGSEYISIPLLAGATTLSVIRTGYSASLNTSYDRVAVYPSSTVDVYGSADPGPISSVISTLPDASPIETITLSSSHQFLLDSPERRFFIVRDPITYCFSGGFLYRYKNYGFQSTMGTGRPTDFLTGREVVVNQLTSVQFSYLNASLSRNGVVSLTLVLAEGGDQQTLDYEVIIRNVP
ncbi:hypothetical protein A9Q99_12215 [Gammaproteobacteria bacterium 45_16_T64]|nr:hypothetical protein A9Q99_12215 [Gammaproteobacteria bacterium 45_16_T64]